MANYSYATVSNPKMEENRNCLCGLVTELRSKISTKKLTSETIAEAVDRLKAIGFDYKDRKFPPLRDTGTFEDESSDAPKSLAEALLWKLGRWKAYKNFANYYADKQSKPARNNVVFYAFAKHLKDQENPIFDQHSLRALWAIS